MLFNSFEFVVFFLVVVSTFFLLPHRFRWLLLLAGSYFFYMSWEPAYVVLILTTTLVAYWAGLRMGQTEDQARRRFYVKTSVIVSLGILFLFKYFIFFNGSLRDLWGWFGFEYPVGDLDVLLPVGISFYTFQTLSYTIDVYRGRVPVEKSAGRFALYVSFFTQLVAGPIERASRLLPQLYKRMTWDSDRVVRGLRLMLWGFFKKMIIADNISSYVDGVYSDVGSFGGASYLFATYFFAVQIYCDFSGYTDIARGAARVLGFELMENFKAPYLARNLSDFWRRWHISLSTWLRDYLYIPLGGNRGTTVQRDRNLMITMVLGGLWHGANWTFLAWGLLHGAYLGFGKHVRARVERFVPLLGSDALPVRVFQMLFTFHLVCLAWVFFRAETISDAFLVLEGIVSWSSGRLSMINLDLRLNLVIVLGGILALAANDVLGRRLTALLGRHLWLRWARDYAFVLVILVFGKMKLASFIYFQF